MEVSIIYRSLLDDAKFQHLLGVAAGNVERAVTKYKTVASWKMLGFYEDDELIGIAGYEKVSSEKAVLLHIAVDPQQRGDGTGKYMIDYICKETRIATLEAETDRSAVEFYRKCGFQITSLGEKYPGVERFRCVLHLERAEDRDTDELVFPVDDANFIEIIEASKQVYWMYQDMITMYGGFGHGIDYEVVDYEKFMLACIVDSHLQGEKYLDLVALVRQGALVALCSHVVDLLDEGLPFDREKLYIEALLKHPKLEELSFERNVFVALRNALEEERPAFESRLDWTELEQGAKLYQVLATVYDEYVVGYFRSLVEKGSKSC